MKFVCRYLSTPGNPKNLRAAEAKRLALANIGIVTVFETTANRALAGQSAGVWDARNAEIQLRTLGAPSSAPVYFAVDFDATPAQQADIDSYLQGAASVLGFNRTGIYGGYWPLSRALTAGACKYGWQTYAWSGGQWFPGAHIRQYLNDQWIAGTNVDFDSSMKTDFGQWDRPLLPRLTPNYAMHARDQKGNLMKGWTTRYPGLSLVRWNVALHKPATIGASRVAV